MVSKGLKKALEDDEETSDPFESLYSGSKEVLADNSGISIQTVRGLRDAGLIDTPRPVVNPSGGYTPGVRSGAESPWRNEDGSPVSEESYRKAPPYIQRRLDRIRSERLKSG